MAKSAPKTPTKTPSKKNASTVRNSRATVSGPAEPDRSGVGDVLAEKSAGTQDLASSLPSNPNKGQEYDPNLPSPPPQGPSIVPRDPIVGASTVTESNGSDKVGSGSPLVGQNPTVGSLDRVRVDSSKRTLTTNQGVPVSDNQHSLKVGLRGPTLLEDFILREKITHFDHERIPERIVHARGSAAHGYFECSTTLEKYTRASLFAETGKQTPVFVRFSTVLGERG
ncbi:MAG: catalase, partial [Acidobacteria bacterium]|nr:catalase [Acidobacteriota bacterium]